MSAPESPPSNPSPDPGVRDAAAAVDGGSREWRFRLILLAMSGLFAFLCGEVALRILAQGKPKPVASESGFTFFAHDPDLGWDLVPNASDRHSAAEFDVEIRIDARGLRSPTPSPDAPVSGGALRLAALGDSFTFGHGVEAREAWPAQLGDELAQVVTENLAVTGYGTDQQMLRFEARADELDPDVVVLGLFAGNVFRNARYEQLGYAKPRFVLEGGELVLSGVPVPEEPPSPPMSRLWALLSRTAGGVVGHLGYGEAWAVTGAILDRLAADCSERGASFFVVILPKDQMIYGSGLRRSLHERMHGRLHQMLRGRGIPYLDLTEALRDGAAAGDRLYFPADGHWTPAGHRVATAAIADWLRPQLGPQELEP
ncbi:MAG: GDSL-type esterase/lipase family protein [Acidobacteriota bacterium]